MTLPITQPPTSGKQLISLHSVNQNFVKILNCFIIINIHFPLDDNSVAEPTCLLPHESHNLGQTQKLNTQQKEKNYAGHCHKTCCKEMLEV